jgi:hypothetical protein
MSVIPGPTDVDVQTWRMARVTRGGGAFAVITWCALAIGVTIGGGVATAAVAFLWVMLVVVTTLVWRGVFAPYISLRRSGIIVQNPFSRVTAPYSDIERVGVGYYGLLLHLKSGKIVNAWAVQKSNLSRILRRRTRLDELADVVNSRLGSQ